MQAKVNWGLPGPVNHEAIHRIVFDEDNTVITYVAYIINSGRVV